jgi:predicted Kef-type K+ transport protein
VSPVESRDVVSLKTAGLVAVFVHVGLVADAGAMPDAAVLVETPVASVAMVRSAAAATVVVQVSSAGRSTTAAVEGDGTCAVVPPL